uniref:Fibronectin type-III domain-containing protein n=1 Tax=Periophthalmus magnuspinnatus TaxID=409849 RepID=A0A3B3ZMI5_9GOBI
MFVDYYILSIKLNTSSIYCLDLNYILHCANDYVSTINCTLQSTLSTDLVPEKLKLIKPMSPCNFTMSQNFSQYSFSWKNSYEEYRDFTNLYQELRYQLRFYQKGQEFNGSAHNVIVDEKTYTIPDGILMPDSEYAAKVRSRPNQVHYKGHWSDWSTEIYWTTGEGNISYYLKSQFVKDCLYLMLCLSALVSAFSCRWKLKTFIPTPEPYFHTLYTDCHGDFKVGFAASFKPIYNDGMHPQSRSPAEGDSGCWLSSDHSLERGPSWYCNDYCTLSTFQQSALGTSEPLKYANTECTHYNNKKKA